MANRGCSLLLRNLRYETTPEKVREIFERIGRVKDVYLPIDHTTREPRYALTLLTLLFTSDTFDAHGSVASADHHKKAAPRQLPCVSALL